MKTKLSERELTVVCLAVRGFTDDMIARELGIQTGTVNSYWVRIRGKLGNLSRTELVAQFVQRNADQAIADHTAEAAALAESNRAQLEEANAEIERLRRLLSNREKKK